MKKYTAISFFLFLFQFSLAQDRSITVSGRVTESESGVPVPTANVIEKGTTNGVMTDFNGEFSITVPPDAILEISYVGYATKEVPVNGRINLEISLSFEAAALEEVVLTGYTAKRKTELSSSVSTVSGDELNDVTSNDVATLLQGKAAGVIVSSSSGNPNETPSIIIRGSSSITAGSEPLYVVDGIIGGSANPNDIASVTVLKDAAATGLYGSRASNGVIIITTKRGNAGKTQININSTLGYNKVTNGNYEVMNSQQLYDYHKSYWDPETFLNDRPAELLSQDTDWHALLFDTGKTNSTTVTVSGGSEKTKMYVSGNYYLEEGTLGPTGTEAFNVRSNISHDINEKLTIGVRINARIREKENEAAGSNFLTNHENMPWDNPYNPDGTLRMGTEEGWIGRDNDNFLHGWFYNFDNADESSFTGDLLFDYNIFKGLTFSSNNRAGYGKEKRVLYYDVRSKAGVGEGRVTNDFFQRRNLITSNRLNYQTNFDDHSLSAIAVAEAETNFYDFTRVEGGGLAPGLYVMDAASVILGASSETYDNAFIKGLIQVDYDFADRYFVVGSFIREASSRFGANNRSANFYTIGTSWVLSNETFMENQEIFDLLKVRASYGITGNAQIGNYQTLGLYSYSIQYAGNSGAFPSQLANPNLTWEKAESVNLGLDIGMFDRISLNLDIYQKLSKALLLNVELPFNTGFSSVIQNVGSVRNRGLELNLNTINLNGELKWETNFNIAFNKNSVVSLDQDKDIIETGSGYDPSRIIRVGEDLNSWYMRKWAGVDPENGDPLWERVTTNGNGEEVVTTTNNYSEATLQIVGSYTPEFTGGMNNEFSYKAFTLSSFFNFVSGVQVWNYIDLIVDSDGAFTNENQRVLTEGESRWQQPGDIATHPRAVFGGNQNSNQVSSRYLQDGSYIRLRNVKLSYKIPTDFLSRLNVTDATMFVSGDNLWTITPFTGRDPQASFSHSGGLASFYPISKRILFGVNIQL